MTSLCDLQQHASVAPVVGAGVRASQWNALPASIDALYITVRAGAAARLAESLAADKGCVVRVTEALGLAAGIEALRLQPYELVLVQHEPGVLDAIDAVEMLRAAGIEDPVLLLGMSADEELPALACEVGADGYLCIPATATRTLLWSAARAVQRHALLRENAHFAQAERQRLQQEHREADHLLSQQKALVHDLEALARDAATPAAGEHGSGRCADSASAITLPSLPTALTDHYRDLLRRHILHGAGNLNGEMTDLAASLAACRITAGQTMLLHVQALEAAVQGLGTRSARHVMARADLLGFEMMVQLADSYRQRLLHSAS